MAELSPSSIAEIESVVERKVCHQRDDILSSQ